MSESVAAHCRKCREELTTAMPIVLDDFLALSRSFMARHKRLCGKDMTFMGPVPEEVPGGSKPSQENHEPQRARRSQKH